MSDEADAASVAFAALRALKRVKTGNATIGLTQVEVDAFNSVIEGWAPPPSPSAIPDDYWPMLAQIESANKLYALPPINPRTGRPYSSASGLYQFIQTTWIGEGGKWGDDPFQAFGGLKPTAEEQLQRAKSFTEKNVSVLKAKGIPINKASLYAAHFFGPATAAKVIAADVNERADLIAGPGPTNANPSILRGKTVGEFLTWLHSKTGAWAR
jgi:hypothetical protein